MENGTKKRMTLNELAKELNVSRTTLYNIMHQKGSFSEETEERVKCALENYHYRMNNHARNLAKNQEYRIAFVGFYSTRFSYFFDEIKQGVEQAMRYYEDDGLQVIEAYSDREKPEEQIADIERLEKQGIENYIIFCYHYEKIYPTIKRLIDTGKKVIIFSREVPNLEPICRVGCNHYLSGKLAAEVLVKFTRPGSRIQLLISEHNHKDKLVNRERLEGFYEMLKPYADKYVLLPPAWISPVPSDAKKEIRQILDKREPDSIMDFVCDLGCVSRYLIEKGREDTVLVGYDIYEEIVPYIQDSVIDAIIYQDLPGQSFTAIKLMFEYICYGKKPEKDSYYLPLNIIMASNCEYYELGTSI